MANPTVNRVVEEAATFVVAAAAIEVMGDILAQVAIPLVGRFSELSAFTFVPLTDHRYEQVYPTSRAKSCSETLNSFRGWICRLASCCTARQSWLGTVSLSAGTNRITIHYPIDVALGQRGIPAFNDLGTFNSI